MIISFFRRSVIVYAGTYYFLWYYNNILIKYRSISMHAAYIAVALPATAWYNQLTCKYH